VAADREVIPEPDDLIRGFEESIEDMLRELPAKAAATS